MHVSPKFLASFLAGAKGQAQEVRGAINPAPLTCDLNYKGTEFHELKPHVLGARLNDVRDH